MPTPYIFNSRAEIVSRLRQHQQTWTGLFRDVRDQIRAKYHRVGVEEIVTASVGNNTFRAFHGCNVPPSKLFRSWGVKEFSETLERVPKHKPHDISASIAPAVGSFNVSGHVAQVKQFTPKISRNGFCMRI